MKDNILKTSMERICGQIDERVVRRSEHRIIIARRVDCSGRKAAAGRIPVREHFCGAANDANETRADPARRALSAPLAARRGDPPRPTGRVER